MSQQVSPRRRTRARKSPKEMFRRIAEFKGIKRLSLQQYQDEVRDKYDGPAGAVLALASLVSLHEPLVGQMFKKGKFDVSGCRRLLDVGSGAGQILGHLVRETNPDAQLVAYDLSHQMLKRARARINNRRPSYCVGDITQLPFADGTFDCITCGWVIEHLPDPRPGLLEFARVLQPNGRLFLMATEDTLQGLVVSHTWKCRTFSRQELKSACDDAGLPWQKQYWFSPIHRFLRIGGILVEARKPAELSSAT